MPFSIEPYFVYDSIIATYRDNYQGEMLHKRITNTFLVTGYDDTLVEKRIDSALADLIHPDYLNQENYYIRFYKKNKYCNNDFTRQARETAEVYNDTEYCILSYDFNIGKEVFSIVKTRVDRSSKDPQVHSFYLRWALRNRLAYDEDVDKKSISTIPVSERNPGLEKIFDRSIAILKSRLPKGQPDKIEVKTYSLDTYTLAPTN